ncbi:MAG: type II secretion system minor pseudopilin GspI [Proteobacteria bacterium]|nr:type II secretion system minor pseudopilin GspI [Pseudomonadota bacterium]
MNRTNRRSGFTLIEIMVALAVFAIVATTLLRNAATSVSQSRQLKDRAVAQWIAENEIQRLRMLERTELTFPSSGLNRTTLMMADREWQIEVDISPTENDLVRRIEVSVRDEQSPDVVLADLTGFLGRY